MKSITIHGLDDKLDKKIRMQAKKDGTSLNKTIKRLLEGSLGIHGKGSTDNRNDFIDLYGIWTKSDLENFNSATEDLNIIDKEDWS